MLRRAATFGKGDKGVLCSYQTVTTKYALVVQLGRHERSIARAAAVSRAAVPTLYTDVCSVRYTYTAFKIDIMLSLLIVLE